MKPKKSKRETEEAENKANIKIAINSIQNINLSTDEGKLLAVALIKLSTESQTDKTFEQIIQQCKVLAKDLFGLLQGIESVMIDNGN